MGANASIVEARAIKMARVEGDALIFMVHCLFCVCGTTSYDVVGRWIGWIHRRRRLLAACCVRVDEAGGCQHFRLSSIPC